MNEKIPNQTPLKLFSTKIDTWEHPITMRAWDEHDAEELARMIFNIPTNIKITAIPIEQIRRESRKGRKALNIPLDLICDTLQNSENVNHAAEILGCSRGYIYKVAGKEKIRELVRV